jgi:DNA sulfur modification protein DndB
MSKVDDFKTVKPDQVQASLADGWEISRSSRRSCRMKRPKQRDGLLEDRVWTLLYRMGFHHLSGVGGAKLASSICDEPIVTNQLDVVGLDQEVAVAVECKTSMKSRKPSDFQRDVAKLAVLKQSFAQSVHEAVPLDGSVRRVPVLMFFTWGLILSQTDKDRAKSQQVVLFDERDLEYYEQLVQHLGQAAKYQFFADMLPHKRVRGLETSVPALKAKMGGTHTCYTFSIKPEYLLKIAYVSHRAKGKATDVDTYQRMIKKSRLKKIRKYIDESGMFPTNIVVSLDAGVAQFEPRAEGDSEEGAEYGTLRLKPTYRAAWIIDGQHRLFGYSGHPTAATSYLSVLAFDNLPASDQAQLFIDINHEQKSVKTGLLQELFAELNWNSDDDEILVRAIASKAIQALGVQGDSPFCGRILLTDDRRTDERCVTLPTLFSALTKARMFTVKTGVEYGPLWAGDREATLHRTIEVVKGWFTQICDGGAQEWWDLGSAEGGGLAMNDGVTVCIAVLRSVFEHLSGKGMTLIRLSTDELLSCLRPFGLALGGILGSLDLEDRKGFRRERGVQGQTAGRIMCEKALHAKFPEFSPEGLALAMEAEAANTRQRAYAILERLERKLFGVVIETIKDEYGEDAELWWYEGVPQAVRSKAAVRIEEDQGRRGSAKESYLDLLDFKDIASKNWELFKGVLSRGRGKKELQLHWVDELNDIRKIVMHSSKNVPVTLGQLAKLEGIEEWLDAQLELEED